MNLSWLQKTREPGLFNPLGRYWLSTAISVAACYAVVTGLNPYFDGLSWAFVMAVSVMLTAITGYAVFSRVVGESQLGQNSAPKQRWSLPRVVVMASIFGWIVGANFSSFNPITIIKLIAAILLAGLIFELTLGRLAWFKPTPPTSPTSLSTSELTA